MLMPKRVKHRRVHRGRMKGKATKGNKVTYGDYGLQATECGWITSNQIEAARIAMTRSNARELLHFFSLRTCNRAQWEIRELADRMLCICKEKAPLLFEIAGVPEETAREALRLATHKLPVKCKFAIADKKKDGEE